MAVKYDKGIEFLDDGLFLAEARYPTNTLNWIVGRTLKSNPFFQKSSCDPESFCFQSIAQRVNDGWVAASGDILILNESEWKLTSIRSTGSIVSSHTIELPEGFSY